LTTLGYFAFEGAGITSVTLPGGIRKIDVGTFESCIKLTSVSLNSGIKEIGNEAFSYCVNLLSITVPSTVKSIGFRVFEGCYNLETLVLPDSVTSIGGNSFLSCPKLVAVCKAGTEGATALSRDNVPFVDPDKKDYQLYQEVSEDTGEKFVYILKYTGTQTNVSIPLTIKGKLVLGVKDHAFSMNETIQSVSLPSNAKYIGKNAFANCPSLAKVQIYENVVEIGDDAFSGSDKVIVYVKSGSAAHTWCVDNDVAHVIF